MSTLFSTLLAIVLFTPLSSTRSPIDAGPGAQKVTKASIEIVGYQPKNDLFLECGQKFIVHIKGVSAERLRVVYRPTSAVEHFEDAGALEDGKVVWTPGQAGLARLEAVVIKKDDKGKDKVTVLAKRVVSIRPGPGFPVGLLLMCVAGAILFLGAFLSIRTLLRG